MSFWNALTTAVLPVLSIAAIGFVLGAYLDVDVEPLSVVTIYVLAPALVFHSVATTTLNGGEILSIVTAVGAFTVLMAYLGEFTGRLNGESGAPLSGLVLSSTFSNCGNYGIPLSTFAFGAIGRSTAVLYLVSQNLFMYTLGVYLASRDARASSLGATLEIFRLPLVYALVAAVLARRFDVLPGPDTTLMSTIELTGNAAIPVMLLLLGLQLARTDHAGTFRRMVLPSALRLGVAPVAGVAVALLVGFSDATVARVFVLESSMPVAITPLMLAIEYDDGTEDPTAPEYISTAIFTTTLLSVPTVALLVSLLRSGTLI